MKAALFEGVEDVEDVAAVAVLEGWKNRTWFRSNRVEDVAAVAVLEGVEGAA